MLQECKLAKKVVDNMKTGSMPAADKIAIIASYLDLSTDYLLGMKEKSENDKVEQIDSVDGLLERLGVKNSEYKKQLKLMIELMNRNQINEELANDFLSKESLAR